MIIRALARLPLDWQLALGRRLGRLFGVLARSRRRIVDINLKLCFPDLSERERQALTRAQFAALGMGVFETAAAWWGSDAQIKNRGEVVGLEHLRQALASGRGVLLLTGHFTTLEMGARFITFHHDFHAMYRPHENPLFEGMMRRAREQRSRRAPLGRDDVRAVLRALRQGHIVWYAPDQNVGRRNAVFVPFFGVPARTLTATSRLARSGNALVVPYFPERLANGHYRVSILPALDNFPSEDMDADTERIMALLEIWIRRAPEQYLWLHRRFRSRLPGTEKLY